ncbi:MAG TPA: hypothetical protein VFP35_02800 [Candidatus Saccharimonadales bacterium]|nr:hypothetical protein [Candidatus Saccharimonadales bacterium]
MAGEKLLGAKSRAEQRTLEMAMDTANRAAAVTREVVDRHVDLLGEDLAELMVHRDYEAAYQEIVRKREAGELNNEASQAPGLTAYLTEEGASTLKDIPGISDYAEGLEMAPGMLGSWRLRINEGIYSTGWGNIQFHGRGAVEPDGNFSLQEDPFFLGYGYVVRVEGDNGELWQNRNYNPDGSSKEVKAQGLWPHANQL